MITAAAAAVALAVTGSMAILSRLVVVMARTG